MSVLSEVRERVEKMEPGRFLYETAMAKYWAEHPDKGSRFRNKHKLLYAAFVLSVGGITMAYTGS